jgi:hypothetical protein
MAGERAFCSPSGTKHLSTRTRPVAGGDRVADFVARYRKEQIIGRPPSSVETGEKAICDPAWKKNGGIASSPSGTQRSVEYWAENKLTERQKEPSGPLGEMEQRILPQME